MNEPSSPECQAAVRAIGELLNAHLSEAEDFADEDGKFSIGFRVTFDRSHSPTQMKVTCRVSRVMTDEIACAVDDPQQPKLPL